MPERAIAEARTADRAIARGTARSPLAGIPYGAKDLLAARGAATTWGAPPFREQVFDFDATAVERLRRAGAVLVAKLAMVELAGGGGYRYPDASLQGPGVNPWHPRRWSGGSSSGSGSAVAADLVPYALGSETSGSIGTPAAFCGITGLRPTYGLVSRHGAMALSWTLDKIGPMARSAEDCAIVLEAIAGPDARDPTLSGRRFRRLEAREARRAIREVTVGHAAEDIRSLAAAPARRALARGVAEFRRVAPRFRRAVLPVLPYGAAVGTVYLAEGATTFAELIEDRRRFGTLVDAPQKAGLRAGLTIAARDYLQAMRLRTIVMREFARLFADVDVILSFGRANTANRIASRLDRPRPRRPAGGRYGNAALIAAANLAGLPAIFFPCGLGTDGLPVGLQLVGPPFSEPLLVALAAAYQRETDHHLQRPPL